MNLHSDIPASILKDCVDFALHFESHSKTPTSELFANLQLTGAQNIPRGYVAIREDAEEIVALDYQQFLQVKDVQSLSILTEEDWTTLIQHGKITNTLQELRSLATRMKTESTSEEKERSHTQFHFKFSPRRDALISRIVQLKLTQDEHSKELEDLRRQLAEISRQATEEEQAYLKFINDNLRQSRQHWNGILHLIHEQEKGSYSINDFNFASNRANRAKVLTDDDDDAQLMDIVDHSGVPTMECAICMDEGPLVLWLKSPENLDDSTNDFLINFPLEGNEKLQSCLVSNPVCGLCAKAYVAASVTNTGQLETLYRERCSGYLPLNWSIESNRRLALRSLYRIVTGQRVLPHVSMLLMAMIDDHRSNWFPSDVKDYLLRQMVENIFTTDTFSDEGRRMPFVQALKAIVQQPQMLLRQPWRAVCRLLKFNVIFHQLNEELIIVLLRKRFLLLCIEKFCSRSKHGAEQLKIVREELYDIIFDTLCGIPAQHSLKTIDIHQDQLSGFLGSTHQQLIDTVTNDLHLDLSRVFPPALVTFVLYLMTTVTIHDRPMKLFADFALKHSAVRETMEIDWEALTKQVDEQVFGLYHSPREQIIPPFAINLGPWSCPSKLFFLDEPLWSEHQANKRITLAVLMNTLKTNLDDRMTEFFGSAVPNQSSARFALHRVVADVLESLYPTDDDLHEEMIVNCLLQLSRKEGRAGNIYATKVFSVVVLAIEDYLKFRRRTKSFIRSNNENLSRSYKHKVLSELLANGMEYDPCANEVFFQPSKLVIPQLIVVDDISRNFNALKQRVQQCYIDRKKQSNLSLAQTCLTVEIKEFIEFAFQMSPEELLPIWAE